MSFGSTPAIDSTRAGYSLWHRCRRRGRAGRRRRSRGEKDEKDEKPSQPGRGVASANRAPGSSEELRILEQGPGDGRVPRSSALLDERVGTKWSPELQSAIDWKATLFMQDSHLGMTSNPIFSDNVLYWLLEEPRD